MGGWNDDRDRGWGGNQRNDGRYGQGRRWDGGGDLHHRQERRGWAQRDGDGEQTTYIRPRPILILVGPAPEGPEGEPGIVVRDPTGQVFRIYPSYKFPQRTAIRFFAGLAKTQAGTCLILADYVPKGDVLWVKEGDVQRPPGVTDGASESAWLASRLRQENSDPHSGTRDGEPEEEIPF